MVKSTRSGPFRTTEEKLEIVAEYEQAPQGMKGGVLRRHNTSQRTVSSWAYARDHNEFGPGLKGNRVAGKTMTPKTQSAEIMRLRRELAKAQADQEILKSALESMGKAHALLEKLAESAELESLLPASEKRQLPTSSTTD